MGKNTVTPPSIDAAIKKTGDISDQFTALANKLQDELADKWKNDMGIEMPTVLETDVRSIKVFAQYSKGLNSAPYVADVKTLIGTASNPSVANKVNAIASVVGNIIEMAIGSISVSATISSNAIKVKPTDGDPFIVSTYVNIVQADSSRFGIEEKFFVAAFAFIVWTPKVPAIKAVLSMEELSI